VFRELFAYGNAVHKAGHSAGRAFSRDGMFAGRSSDQRRDVCRARLAEGSAVHMAEVSGRYSLHMRHCPGECIAQGRSIPIIGQCKRQSTAQRGDRPVLALGRALRR
jgi:hypothetical protein